MHADNSKGSRRRLVLLSAIGFVFAFTLVHFAKKAMVRENVPPQPAAVSESARSETRVEGELAIDNNLADIVTEPSPVNPRHPPTEIDPDSPLGVILSIAAAEETRTGFKSPMAQRLLERHREFHSSPDAPEWTRSAEASLGYELASTAVSVGHAIEPIVCRSVGCELQVSIDQSNVEPGITPTNWQILIRQAVSKSKEYRDLEVEGITTFSAGGRTYYYTMLRPKDQR
jgi:hypothetical protein